MDRYQAPRSASPAVSLKKRRIVLFLLLLFILAGGWYAFRPSGHHASSEEAKYFAPVTQGDIEEVVTSQGKLEPKEYVDVGAQVSGQLKKIYVEIGDVVEKGALLAEIDPRIYESRVEADKARLNTLKAQLAEQAAQIDFAGKQQARNERLIKSDAISQETLEDSATNLKVAKARKASLEAQIKEEESTLSGDTTNLGYTKIYAPMAGTIVLQPVQEGQTINASQQAPTILQIANLDIMTVRAQVAEADVMRISAGSPVYFTTLGSLERRWQGTVRQVLPSPDVVNDVVLYNVLVDVDNRDRQLMTGMSTQMFFVLGSAKGVPIIPLEALGKRVPAEDGKSGQAYQVRTKEGGAVVEKTIHVGLMNRSVVEVRDGISVGDEVATSTNKAADDKKRGGGFTRGPRL